MHRFSYTFVHGILFTHSVLQSFTHVIHDGVHFNLLRGFSHRTLTRNFGNTNRRRLRTSTRLLFGYSSNQGPTFKCEKSAFFLQLMFSWGADICVPPKRKHIETGDVSHVVYFVRTKIIEKRQSFLAALRKVNK